VKEIQKQGMHSAAIPGEVNLELTGQSVAAVDRTRTNLQTFIDEENRLVQPTF
jgi:hypothetical protein